MSAAIKAATKPQAEVRGTATAPLLYWLAVICGLTGITIIRFDQDASHVVPIWFGAIVGIALGQLIAVLRIRIWTSALFALMSSWLIGPALYIGLCELFGYGTDTETALMALLPAFICGYASLTERGGLLAFWYPAMLWMLVILDGETPGTFAPHAYMPMVVGLGVFFVAFLRARETRRAALWRAYSHSRLAKPGESSILSASPIRGMSELAWTALVGSGAFLLAAWVAPNLWQKDRALHKKMAQVPATTVRYSTDSNMPCCPESWQTEKIKEYMPLKNDRESDRTRLACSYCPPPVPAEAWGSYGSYRGAGVRTMDPATRYYGYDYVYNATTQAYSYQTYSYGDDIHTNYAWNTYQNNNNNTGNSYGYHWTPPTVQQPVADLVYTTPPPPPVVPTYVPPVQPIVDHKTPLPPKAKPAVAHTPTPVVKPAHIDTPKVATPTPELPKPQIPAVVVTPSSPAPEPSAPWGILFPLMAGVFLLPMGTRFVRRQFTLRHLARPFWKEPIDQRISNQWQRMLIGLRDAGIQIRVTEQPGQFAKRIAIKGMEDCATILERVRHGVRVEDEDLATMGKATDEIYETARKRAGVAGRIAGSFRWPLV